MKQKDKIFKIRSWHMAIMLLLLITGINVKGATKPGNAAYTTDMEQLETLYEDKFSSTILTGTTCILFYNEDAEVCREMEQNLVKVKNGYDNTIHFFKMDFSKVTNQVLQHSIPGTPSVLIFKDGTEKAGIMGLSSVSNLKNVIGRYQ